MKKKKKLYFKELADKYRGDGVEPRCKHFDKCGGCMFQDISYENQLLLKREYINDTMKDVCEITEVHPGDPFHYRNRMDMVTAFGKAGLREAGSYKFVVDIENCDIMQQKTNSIFQKLRPLLLEIEQYNYLSHKGYHRYVVLREAATTGETMANFVIAQPENRVQNLIDCIKDDVDSISILLSDGMADLSYGPVFEDVKRGYIEENFDGIKYRITPNSFFQSNTPVAVTMYREIKKQARGKVLDLYSGVGSITLFAAANCEHITGVEIVEEAVETAEVNREINGINNASFVCADAGEFIKERGDDFDTLILDPPRSGMHPKMLRHINTMAPERIIYMSCNPATFRNDLDGLEGYELEGFEAYDMFPQTPHVESLAVLGRK